MTVSQGIVFSLVIVRLGLGLSTSDGVTHTFKDVGRSFAGGSAFNWAPSTKTDDFASVAPPNGVEKIKIGQHGKKETTTTDMDTSHFGEESSKLQWTPVRSSPCL